MTDQRHPPASERQTASSQRATLLWRGFAGAVIVTICTVLVIGVLWLAARNAPSAGSDPHMTPLVLVPTRVPTPAPAPAVAPNG